ncbi:MAG TPA: SHOCT domain-containing protein [Actinocatenispora sp.]
MWWHGPVFFWPLFPLLWVGVAVLAFTLLRRRRGWPMAWRTAPAEQTLADRFARGEIDEQEYEERMSVLRKGKP